MGSMQHRTTRQVNSVQTLTAIIMITVQLPDLNTLIGRATELASSYEKKPSDDSQSRSQSSSSRDKDN